MKYPNKTLIFATAMLALPMLVLAQTSNNDASQSGGATSPSGQRAAMKMVPVQAELMQTLDAKKTTQGAPFTAKLAKAAHLDDGTTLPSGTILQGTVAQDDMQQQGASKLALRFTSARLKDGSVVPLKATIVGIFDASNNVGNAYSFTPGDQVSNNWTDKTLKVDQIGVVSGVDLHSNVASQNSGVLVSAKKDNVTLRSGSEIQLAIAGQHDQALPGANGAGDATSNEGR